MKNENGRRVADEDPRSGATAPPASGDVKPVTLLPGAPKKKNGRQPSADTLGSHATASAATAESKPLPPVPRSPKNGRLATDVTQRKIATAPPANARVKPKEDSPGASSRTARQGGLDARLTCASAPPGQNAPEAQISSAVGATSSIVETIRAHHRARRFAMGIQQVLDNKLGAFVRINATDWHPTDDESERTKANKEVAVIIKAAREGQGDPLIIGMVAVTDKAREPADAERAKHEKAMETLAKQLPVAAWVENIPGFGMLGLATIIAETGDLAMYSNVAKVWKRLGYAPYKDKAGSTWKRPKWRNADALTAEEWTENPFSGRRYALIHTIGVWLKNKQWVGAAKTEDGVGIPNGYYGTVYAARRAHTSITHPEWTKAHAHMDGLRVMMKQVLKDLYLEWNQIGRQHWPETQRARATAGDPARVLVQPKEHLPGSL